MAIVTRDVLVHSQRRDDSTGVHRRVPVAEAIKEARSFILAAGFSRLDYVNAVDPASLQDLPDGPLAEDQACRLLAAAWMGSTRLIDNLGV